MISDAYDSVSSFLGGEQETTSKESAPNQTATPIGSGPQAASPQEPGFLEQAGQTLGDLGRGVAQEGVLSLMFDRRGMMDRQQAQRELAGKFDVVPDDHTGPRLPNQVTETEFQDRIARTYSDIRLGRADLKIDGSSSKDPEQFQEDMMDDVGDIMQTKSGRAMVNELAYNTNGVDERGRPIHRTTTLTPNLDRFGNPDTSNAFENGDSSPGNGSPFPNGRPGVGSDATVRIMPNVPSISGMRSDVVLFHELAHAYHDTKGTTDMSKVEASDGIPGDASFRHRDGSRLARYEHQAVGLGIHSKDPFTENRYRGERNDVAASGKGMSDDATMPQRDRYANYRGR